MKETVATRLHPEDLAAWRQVLARFEAVRINPNAYSAQETEKIIEEHMRILGDFYERYGLLGDVGFRFDAVTGYICRDEED